MRRVAQLAALGAWCLWALHDPTTASVALPALALGLLAGDAPGLDRLVPREAAVAEAARRAIAGTRWAVPAPHRPTGRRNGHARFPSRPPPVAAPA